MGQAYSEGFAKVYNLRWGGFAQQLAPRLQTLFESHLPGPDQRSLVDICCGAGHLTRYFLEAGYRVTGIDLSPGMLKYAIENAQPYLDQGQAEFLLADAASFSLSQPVWCAVSTFDALNHLPDLEALQGCFRSTEAALEEGGWFVFDLNTRTGLKRHWNGISVEDEPELALINRAVFDEAGGRGYTKITGFLRLADGRYERFEETVYNTAFDLEAVRQAVLDCGFRSVYLARGTDLPQPVGDPEAESRAFFVAQK